MNTPLTVCTLIIAIQFEKLTHNVFYIVVPKVKVNHYYYLMISRGNGAKSGFNVPYMVTMVFFM